MPKVAVIIAAPFLFMTLLVAATGVVLVDVREGGPDGMHIVVPVPLLAAQVGLGLAPEEARYVECPELERWAPIAEKVVAELRQVEDFTLVEVRDGSETVLIRKVGDSLTVDVIGNHGEEVHVRVPLRSAAGMLRAYDGEGFSTRAAIRALRGAPRGKLVHVKDGEDEIKIRLL